jgi:chromosomal replication initiator protein
MPHRGAWDGGAYEEDSVEKQAVQVWQTVLGQLQMEMPKAAFDTWVRDTRPVALQDGKLVVGVHNAYARDWLESRLRSTVRRKLAGLFAKPVDVDFVVWTDEAIAALEADDNGNGNGKGNGNGNGNNGNGNGNGHHSRAVYAPPPSHSEAAINPRYTFENFVVGSNNRLAHAASMAVAENPANAYNPLFLYGGVGLGKTHLLHAIGNACLAQGLVVRYVSSEEFTNDLINAIRSHNTETFRDKYRKVDVLLIDDIQFIAGKESTQEEFFHTFNTLHGQNKQIVLTSDRPPKALVTLEERLRSRFEWGLTADIQPPDFETRVAILRFKAEEAGKTVPMEILETIARYMHSNIRELEGALTRVLAYAELRGMPLTPQLVEAALADMLPRRQEIVPERILQAVAEAFGLSVERLRSKSRAHKVALPRQVAMYLLREDAKLSLPQIGELLGGRDHTTVKYGYEKIADKIESDERLRRQVLNLREKLYRRSTPLTT